MTEENDLLQKFIDNEQRSKFTTLFFVIIFILVAIGILFMAYKLNKKTLQIKQLTSNNKEYERIIDSLSRPYVIQDSFNNIRTKKLVEEVKVRNILIKEVGKDISNKHLDENSKVLQKQIQQITNSSQDILKPQKSYTVYIQYNSLDNAESIQITRLKENLLAEGFNVPEAEYRRGTFRDTYVCYFHDEDKVYAEEVYEKLHKNYSKAIIRKKNMKAPKKQIEIWINSFPE